MSEPERSDLSVRAGHNLDHASDVPLHRQLSDQLLQEILEGVIVAGERLPTARQLAIDLGIHPQSVERALGDLELKGVIARRPEGTFVSLGRADEKALEKTRRLDGLCGEIVSRARALQIPLDAVIDALVEVRAAASASDGKE